MTLLIFDIDGTLTTDNYIATEAFRKTVKSFLNITNYSENWKEYTSDSDTGILSHITKFHLQKTITQKELLNFEEHYLKTFESLLLNTGTSVTPVKSVRKFLLSIASQAEFKTVLFTGGFPKVAQKKLDLISIDKNLLLAAAFDGYSREEIFIKCLSKAEENFDLKFDNIILFGDSDSDIKISKKYNIPMVGITTHISREAFLTQGIQHTLLNYENINAKDLISYVCS